MNREELISLIQHGPQKKEVRTALEEVYHYDIPEEIIRILSSCAAPELFDENESRTLSIKEVINAEEDLQVPFRSEGMIPIVDLGDNDYIVYCFKDCSWRIYNVLDQSLFKETENFKDLFMN